MRNGNPRIHKVLEWGDGINLTGIRDQLDPTRDEVFGYSAANRLGDTLGLWGELDFDYDGVGNRISRALTPPGGATSSDAISLAPGSNRILGIATNGAPSRSFTYDGAGNILTDAKGGVTTTYGYDAAGRLASVNVGSSARGPYLYNAFAQLVSRTVTAGVPASTIHMLYDLHGNLIAEANAQTGATMREYVWLEGQPIAAFANVDTGSPIPYYVHVDHLDRPATMTDAGGATVWRASYLPFGEVRTINGSATFDHRFPGQWFMAETGLHYNWHRWYDASLGRYTQPDPLGMPHGPNRFAYALNSPLMYVDPDGRIIPPGTHNLWNWIFPPAPNACFMDDDERCKEVLKECKQMCTELYVDDRDSLPGSGTNFADRLQKCIRNCLEANKCFGVW